MEVKILDVRKYYSAVHARAGQFDTAVTYQWEGRSYFVVLSAWPVTDAMIKAAIAADLQALVAHVGKTLTIP